MARRVLVSPSRVTTSWQSLSPSSLPRVKQQQHQISAANQALGHRVENVIRYRWRVDQSGSTHLHRASWPAPAVACETDNRPRLGRRGSSSSQTGSCPHWVPPAAHAASTLPWNAQTAAPFLARPLASIHLLLGLLDALLEVGLQLVRALMLGQFAQHHLQTAQFLLRRAQLAGTLASAFRYCCVRLAGMPDYFYARLRAAGRGSAGPSHSAGKTPRLCTQGCLNVQNLAVAARAPMSGRPTASASALQSRPPTVTVAAGRRPLGTASVRSLDACRTGIASQRVATRVPSSRRSCSDSESSCSADRCATGLSRSRSGIGRLAELVATGWTPRFAGGPAGTRRPPVGSTWKVGTGLECVSLLVGLVRLLPYRL